MSRIRELKKRKLKQKFGLSQKDCNRKKPEPKGNTTTALQKAEKSPRRRIDTGRYVKPLEGFLLKVTNDNKRGKYEWATFKRARSGE